MQRLYFLFSQHSTYWCNHSLCGEKAKEVMVIDADAYESSTVADTWWLKEFDLFQSNNELITSNRWLSAPIITSSSNDLI